MKHTSRALAALLTLAAAAPAAAQQDNAGLSLKEAYTDHFTIGVAVNLSNIDDPEQAALVCREFNSITAENVMKPQLTEPGEDHFNWAGADSVANFCRAHGIKLRGHCLMWHQQVPEWLFVDKDGKEVPKQVLFERMRHHINAIVTRYKDVVYCWDVVNEAIADGPATGQPYRDSRPYRIAGDEFIRRAFIYARQADPDALLFYNDYSLPDPAKRDRVYHMVKQMKADGIPIDGIGMQGHYNIHYPTPEALDSAITLFSTIVDHIHITELDIRTNREQGGALQFARGAGTSVSDETKQALADQYARVFAVFRRHSDIIDNVTFWNLSDRDSWLGAANYPLPFDTDYQPKAAYHAIRDFAQPSRPLTPEHKKK